MTQRVGRQDEVDNQSPGSIRQEYRFTINLRIDEHERGERRDTHSRTTANQHIVD
jgi:hypothetical protein